MKKEDFIKLTKGKILYNPHQDRIAVLKNDVSESQVYTPACNLYGERVEEVYGYDYLYWEMCDKNTPPKYMIEILWWRVDNLEKLLSSKFII